MSKPDIVAELDRWLADAKAAYNPYVEMRRARDEIVALRNGYTREQMQQACLDNYNAGRAEQRERDAQVIEECAALPDVAYERDSVRYCRTIAAVIRNQGFKK